MKTGEEQDALKSKKNKEERQEREIGIAVDPQKLSRGLKMTFEGVAMIFDSLGSNPEAIGIPCTSKRLSVSLPLKEQPHTEKSEAYIQKKQEQEASKAISRNPSETSTILTSSETTSTANTTASTKLEASSEIAGTTATTERNGSIEGVYAVNELDAPGTSNEASDPDTSAGVSVAEVSAERIEKSEQVEQIGQPQQSDTAKAAKAAKSAINADDITKVIVEKLKQDRDNNKKIEELVHKYRVSVISQLPEEKYEAFMMELVSL